MSEIHLTTEKDQQEIEALRAMVQMLLQVLEDYNWLAQKTWLAHREIAIQEAIQLQGIEPPIRF